MKKYFAALLTGLFMAAAPIQSMAAEYNLILNLPIAPTHNRWQTLLKPWYDELERRSGGRIKIEPYFAESLSKINECLNTVKDGMADFTEAVLSNFPGQLPFHERSWEIADPTRPLDHATEILHQIEKEFPEVMKEFDGAKLLFTYDFAIGHIIGTKDPVNSFQDLKGRKILNFGGPIAASRLKALGMVPVSMSPPDGYMALQQGIVDGAVCNYQLLVSRRYGDIIKYMLPINIMGGSVFMAMNQDTYDSLPPDLQKIIDDMSGDYALEKVEAWLEEEYKLLRTYRDKMGGQVHVFTDEEYAEIRRLTLPCDEEWANTLKSYGLPGDKILARMRQLQSEKDPLWKDSRMVKEFQTK